LVLSDKIRAYYRDNPLMVSSPFGGVEGLNRDLFAATLRALDIDLSGRRILDVGCGRGYAGDWVAAEGGKYVGTDIVASRTGFPLLLADGARLPFGDASFDGIFCIDVFEHFPAAAMAAREFHRVLCDNGFVFLSVPNYSNVAGLVKAYCERIGRYEPNTWAPFRNWQPQELEHAITGRWVRKVFSEAGFSEFRRMGYGAEVGLGLFPWMEHRKMPEAVKFRLQRLTRAVGPAIAKVWPGASLHQFWRIGK